MNSAKLLAKITERWPVKVLSLALALVIFASYNLDSKKEERSFQVPLRLESNERLIPVNQLVETVTLTLKGKPGVTQSISEGDIEAYIDFGKYTKEGTQRVSVQIRKKGSAVGVEPLQITVSPREISLELEEKTSMDIPVFPDYEGTLAQDYELTRYSIIPETVFAEGPRKALENQYKFSTEKIDLEGRFEDITTYVNIVNNDSNITILGSNIIQYHGTIRRIEREAPMPHFEIAEEDDDDDEAETGDNVQ